MESKENVESSSSDKIKHIFTFKFILKIVAISGIFLSCFYISISIYFWINASFRGLSLLNAIFGGITFLTFIYFYFAIYTTKKIYFYNVFALLLVMFIIIFLMALINLLHIQKISNTAFKFFYSHDHFLDIKNDINMQYFINACLSIFLCCYMFFSMVFVEKARENAAGHDQPDSRNPARSLSELYYKLPVLNGEEYFKGWEVDYDESFYGLMDDLGLAVQNAEGIFGELIQIVEK